MSRKKEQNKKIDDILDIHEFIVDVPSQPTTANVAGRRHARTSVRLNQGKDEIDRLIAQDVALSSKKKIQRKHEPASQNLQDPQSTHSSAFQATRASQHVVDLRKHYLIEKNNLHTFDRPVVRHSNARMFFGREKIRWHIPAPIRIAHRRPQSADRHEAERVPFGIRQFSGRSFAAFCLILVMLLAPVPAIRLARHLTITRNSLFGTAFQAFSGLQAGALSFEAKDYAAATERLTGASNDFAAVQQSLDRFAGDFNYALALTPYFNEQLNLARSVADVGKNIADVGTVLSHSLASDGSAAERAVTLKLLGSYFRNIDRSLSSVRTEIIGFNPSKLGQDAAGAVTSVQNNIDLIIDGSSRMARLTDIMNHITGGSAYSRYLILFQNDRELRPTGGFIGSFALVDFSRNAIQSIEFPGGGTYDLDGGFKQHLIPPEPISILNHEWNIWDANWWYDFPTSAKKIAWFYEQSGGPSVDGVIAINARTVKDLLAVVGPIEMPEYGITVTAETFYDVIQREVEVTYDKNLNQPKKVLKDLMPILLERLLASADYRQILATMTSSLRSKDVQISVFDNPAIAQSISDLGWDGSSKNAAKDYLSVITTNVAGGKSDASIYDTIDHDVTIERPGTILVTTRIKREHRADPNDVFAYVNHVDYLRFYIPRGSELLTAAGFEKPAETHFRKPTELESIDDDLAFVSGLQRKDLATGVTIGSEFDKTVFGHWLQVKPGETKIASITYRLPFSIRLSSLTGVRWLTLWDSPEKHEVDSYTVLFQKQSGKNNVILNSSVKLSDRYKVLWSDAVSAATAGYAHNVYTYGTPLETDTAYSLLIGASENVEQP